MGKEKTEGAELEEELLAKAPAKVPEPAAEDWGRGLTLVHFIAQLERFSWDRGCT
jgi:hypothetical protein